jgi:hypothetical protein
MQTYDFRPVELKNVEREIFKFIWSNNDKQNGIDRISRSIMKNEYENGGMRVTDVECLNRSLKLRQFIRANKSKHVIAKIQQLVVGSDSESPTLRQEYHNVSKKDDICSSAQDTINIITDYNREQYSKIDSLDIESDKNLIEEVASIDLKTYLNRKKEYS